MADGLSFAAGASYGAPVVAAPIAAAAPPAPVLALPPSTAAPTTADVPVIDVGGTQGAPIGAPGSQFAPSLVSPSGAGSSGPTMTAPTAPAAPVAAPDPDPAPVATSSGSAASFTPPPQVRNLPAAPPPSQITPSAGMQAPVGAPTTGLSFADGAHFGEPAPTPASAAVPGSKVQQKLTGFGNNVLAGGVEGVTNTLGTLADLPADAVNLGIRGINAGARALGVGPQPSVAGQPAPGLIPQIPTTAPQMLDTGVNAVTGFDPQNVQATTLGQQLARSAASGVTSTLLPIGIAGQAAKLGSEVLGPVAQGVAQEVASTPLASSAGLGATGNVSGTVAQDSAQNAGVAPQYLPLINMAGQMVGGGMALGSVSATKALIDSGTARASTLLQPLTQAGRQTIAGNRIANAATDLPAVREALVAPDQQLVPGSQPTSFQVTQDPGIGTMERGIARTPAAAPRFIARANDQNRARVAAVRALAPEEASPEAIGSAFKQQLSEMNEQNQRGIDRARLNAQRAADEVGGNVPAATPGQQASAQQTFGQRLREGLAIQKTAATRHENTLWKAIDPDDKLTVDMTPIRARAEAMAAEQSPNAEPIQGVEAGIMKTAENLPRVQKFSDLSALRSRLTTAIAGARTDPAQAMAVRRMSIMLDSVHDAMAASAEKQVTQDSALVQSGARTPEQTMLQRLNDWAARQRGEEPSADGSPIAPVGPATYDAAASARYAAARGATALKHATFTNAPGVGTVLARGARADEYQMADSSVPAQILSAGKGAAEKVQAYLRAGGDKDALTDYAAFDLKRSAQDADGTVKPSAVQKWVQQHDEALSGPEFAGFKAKIATASGAREVMQDVMAKHVQQADDFQRSVAGRFIGDADPVARMGEVLTSKSGAAMMRDLIRRTAGNADARSGVQAAIAEAVQRKIMGNNLAGDTELMKSDQAQSYFKAIRPVLSEAFSPKQVESIMAVGQDLQRAAASANMTKVQGGSDTAQNLSGMPHTHEETGFSATVKAIVGEKLAEGVGEVVGKTAGVALGTAGVGLVVLNAFRANGLSKVNEIITEAMLDPVLMRKLLERVPNAAKAREIGNFVGMRLSKVNLLGAVTRPYVVPPAATNLQQPPSFGTPYNVPSVASVLGPQQ